MLRYVIPFAVAAALAACGEKPAAPAAPAETRPPVAAGPAAAVSLGAPETLAVPSDPATASAEPYLETAPDGSVLMTWIERTDSHATVRMARFDGKSWTAPSTIVEADDLFVNWADFPSIHAFESGRLAAHWLQKNGAGKYAYDVRIAGSADGGRSWTGAVTPHKDGTATEHGFVSFAHVPGTDELQAVWLDGRLMTPEGGGHGGGDMTLHWARFTPDGSTIEEEELDRRTCECCMTAMTMTPQGAVVAYRDRSEKEVRDIAVVRQTAGGWSAPAIVHDDGWTIAACPVNGPQLASRGARVAMAWFTVPKGEGIVNVAFSDDAGATWSAPVRVDGGNPIGRVDVVMPADEGAVVTWLERAGDEAEIRARFVPRDGAPGEPLVLGRSTSDRAAGFPRIALAGDTIYAAWTETGDTPRLRFSRVKVNR
ncbi:MAG TPA: sialidase family protein [Thermoanaerobaculia bacterium]